MCSDRCKNHGCTQKIPEGTSSAMFDVRIQAMYFDSIRWYAGYASYCVTITTGVFLGKMCSDRRRNHGCGQKKPEGTSSSRFGIGTAAKCGELKRCADRVCSRTDNKDEVLEDKFVTWNSRFPPKRQLSILLNFFFPLIILFVASVVFAKRPSHHATSGQKRGIQHRVISNWWPCGANGRTDGLTDWWSRDYCNISKISWLDRLPNLPSNGAPHHFLYSQINYYVMLRYVTLCCVTTQHWMALNLENDCPRKWDSTRLWPMSNCIREISHQ